MFPRIRFTLVSTVFNEGDRLAETIADLEKQSLTPDEIIITDSGSTDGTYEKLLQWRDRSTTNIRILKEAGCNIARGRNMAIENAGCELIVSTDFGCRFDRDWLKSLVEPFQNPEVKVTGGGYAVNENDVQTVAARANYLLTGGYDVQMDKNFIPSSRSIAYYKQVWREVGQYPEWLTLAADDLVFGKKIQAKGFEICNVPAKKVFWGRHREARGYAKEAFRYGLGDGEARVNFRNFISNSIELLLRYYLFAGIALVAINFLTGFFHLLVTLAFVPGLMGLRSYKNAFYRWKRFRSSKYHFGIFLFSLWLIERTRTNYIKGYIKGYFFSPETVKKEALALQKMLNTSG